MGAAACAPVNVTGVEHVVADPASEDSLADTEEAQNTKQDVEDPTPTRPITVTIVGARGLRGAGWAPGASRPECYCVLTLRGAEVFKTRMASDFLEPIWREEVELPDYKDGEPLEFSIFDVDGTSFFLGKVSVPSIMFSRSGFHGDLKIEEAGEGADQALLKLKIKDAGKDYPPAPPSELMVSMKKQSWMEFGLRVDTQDGATLLVLLVKDGPFLAYNGGKKAAEKIRKFDFIMSVNNATGPCGMLEEIKTKSNLEVVVRRPQEYLVPIDCSAGGHHGLTFPADPAGDLLVITSVGAGTVRDWNDSQPEDRQVRCGDRIVSVGGEGMRASEIKAKLERGGERFQCLLIRPCSDSALIWGKPAVAPRRGSGFGRQESRGGDASAGSREDDASAARRGSDASVGSRVSTAPAVEP
eukprot:CAMPEP_0168383314 /NCGR_PEP_ID=MMETSP0228-20121227/13839_1 /TAXON_ID=133427 /ORGANISM="Protoceratium reticulatum, Strain CCCM 535 (=CCMP 1889)" /LENGTH=412 /DNA_ID=CAMNT_0008396461 /DNA_START=60 /DNA_END=1298 /DNA_ORIENTATION=-